MFVAWREKKFEYSTFSKSVKTPHVFSRYFLEFRNNKLLDQVA